MNDLLIRAIREKRLISFSYRGGAQRTAEPHDYGVIGGREHLLAYQLTGASSSGAPHGWKDFFTDDLQKLSVLDEAFAGSRGRETERHREWDIVFARVG